MKIRHDCGTRVDPRITQDVDILHYRIHPGNEYAQSSQSHQSRHRPLTIRQRFFISSKIGTNRNRWNLMATKERTIPAKKSLLLRVSSIETPRIASKSGVSCPPQIAVSAGMLIAAKNGKAEHSLENRKTNQRTLPNVT